MIHAVKMGIPSSPAQGAVTAGRPGKVTRK